MQIKTEKFEYDTLKYIYKGIDFFKSKIVNPKTNRLVSIYTKTGKSILRNYINLIGGAKNPNWSSYDCRFALPFR